MSKQLEKAKGFFSVTAEEFRLFIKPKGNPEGLTKFILVIVGLVLSPSALIGALLGYVRAYRRFEEPAGKYPQLARLRPITRIAMIVGGISMFIISVILIGLFVEFLNWAWEDRFRQYPGIATTAIILQVVIIITSFVLFARWRAGIANYISETQRHGTARFAFDQELQPYTTQKGFFIGGNCYYNKAGHLLTVAGTRGGKGVNLILPNLLSPNLFNGSWVVIDPKGENAAVSARVQREAGRKVVMLNPWNMLNLGSSTYNPLDLLKADRLNLADDVQMIAECIVPISVQKQASGGNATEYFDNRARAYISGLLLHLMTAAPEEDRHLGTIWAWLRLDRDKWINLLADMIVNDDANAGDIVRATGHEIASLMKTSDREYASIMSSAQKWTDFIKSPAMRDTLKHGQEFKSSDLQDGNTTVYVIIPADRLKTHNQWLRLVVSALMRATVRNPKKDVCFLLDEFYALGYLSEIDIALGAYAGYGIHVWAILQNLVQLQELYGTNWENFLSSCSVRHFFNVADNTSAEYVSKMFGQTSIPKYDKMGQLDGATPRSLVNLDEMRRESGDKIYTVIDSLHPAVFLKWPYYQMGLPYDTNPYYKA